jgi:hypothetical protein
LVLGAEDSVMDINSININTIRKIILIMIRERVRVMDLINIIAGMLAIDSI